LSRNHTSNGIGSTDFMQLFRPDSLWSESARRVSVFKLYPYFVGRSSDEDLSTVIRELQRRGMALALEARVLQDSGHCRGDGGINTVRLLNRIKSHGGTVTYLAMDEPMKHWFYSLNNCHVPFEQITDNISAQLARFRSIFPSLKVGLIEPVGAFVQDPEVAAHILEFVDSYRRETGEALAFFHADVIWKSDWLPVVGALAQGLKERGIPFGMIYNGTDTAPSDQAWAAEAVSHYTRFEESYGKLLSTPVFQSWVDHPRLALPESDPETLTGIVLGYLRHIDSAP
jgi:hypothetical protein